MSMVFEVGAYVALGGLGVVGVDLFEGLAPSTPDTITSLFEHNGASPIRAHANKIVAEQPILQIVTRAADYETGYARMRVVVNRLQNFTGVLGSTRYLTISLRGSIHSVGTDELRRWVFSANMTVMKEPS